MKIRRGFQRSGSEDSSSPIERVHKEELVILNEVSEGPLHEVILRIGEESSFSSVMADPSPDSIRTESGSA